MGEKNKTVHSCFKLGWSVGLSAMALCAASLPDTPPRLTTTVRADLRTGKLVRVTLAPAQTRAAMAAAVAILPAVERIAAEHSLPPELLDSVIAIESNYNPYAVSPKGALGMMQLLPSTARRFGVADVFDPLENIRGGARYLAYLLNLYRGDYPLALAAYNAGEEAVATYGGVPPYPETQSYVAQVRKRFEKIAASKPHDAAPRPNSEPVQADAEGPRRIREIVQPDGTVRYVSQ
jgi:soluble lytic murein transglycosylase-like protein